MEIEISKHDFSTFRSNVWRGNERAARHAPVGRVRGVVLHHMLRVRVGAGVVEKSREMEILKVKKGSKKSL